MPFDVDMPLTLAQASRMSIVSMGILLEETGVAWPYPVIGGSIQFSSLKGTMTVMRNCTMDFKSKQLKAWYRYVVTPAIADLVMAFAKFTTGTDQMISFESQFDLERWLASDVWQQLVRRVTSSFPRNDCVGYTEKFYGFGFTDSDINWSFFVENKNFECFIVPPSDDLGGITRVRQGKGLFSAIMTFFGFKFKSLGTWWEFFEKNYGTKDVKTVSYSAIINWLAGKGNTPVGFNGAIQLPAYCLWKALILKIFEIVRQQVSLNDWKIELPYSVIMRNVGDKQVTDHFTTCYQDWNSTQVRVPVGDLPHMSDLKLLPITTTHETTRWDASFNNSVTTGTGRNRPVVKIFQIEPLTMQKYIYDVEFRTVIDKKTGEEKDVPIEKTKDYAMSKNVAPDLIWVTIKNFTATDNEQYLAYNKQFGTKTASDTTKRAVCLVNVVYPSEFTTRKIYIPGQEIEPNQWPITLRTLNDNHPPAQVADSRVHLLFNQKTIYGPNYYLIDYDCWINEYGGYMDPYTFDIVHTVGSASENENGGIIEEAMTESDKDNDDDRELEFEQLEHDARRSE